MRGTRPSSWGHPVVGTEHLLLGLLAVEDGIAGGVLRDAGLEPAGVRAAIDEAVRPSGRLVSDADAAALQSIGIDVDAVQERLEQSFGPDAVSQVAASSWRGRFRRRPSPGARFGPRARKVLELSLREAIRLHDSAIGPEHILLGLLREGNGLAAQVITDAGVSIKHLRAATEAARDQAA